METDQQKQKRIVRNALSSIGSSRAEQERRLEEKERKTIKEQKRTQIMIALITVIVGSVVAYFYLKYNLHSPLYNIGIFKHKNTKYIIFN